jgi:hypothetical protein
MEEFDGANKNIDADHGAIQPFIVSHQTPHQRDLWPPCHKLFRLGGGVHAASQRQIGRVVFADPGHATPGQGAAWYSLNRQGLSLFGSPCYRTRWQMLPHSISRT